MLKYIHSYIKNRRCSSAGRFHYIFPAGAVALLILLPLVLCICDASAYELTMTLSTTNLSIDLAPTTVDGCSALGGTTYRAGTWGSEGTFTPTP